MKELMPVPDAVARLVSAVSPLPTEKIHIDDVLGRVLAEEIRAGFNLPHFDNSAMDGFVWHSFHEGMDHDIDLGFDLDSLKEAHGGGKLMVIKKDDGTVEVTEWKGDNEETVMRDDMDGHKVIRMEIEEEHGGAEDPRIILKPTPDLGFVIDARRWDGNDFCGDFLDGIVTARAVDFLVRAGAAPFLAQPLRTRIDGLDADQRKRLEQAKPAERDIHEEKG